MSISEREPQAGSGSAVTDSALVVPLQDLDASWLPLAGGKAAHLGELIGGGFAVPDGFCVTTLAYAQVAAAAGIDPLLAELAGLDAEDTARQVRLAEQVRAALLQAPVPGDVATALSRAYARLGGNAGVPVAVRSSATAEDLPGASFAGQQETYLNVAGSAAVLDAVRRSFASLWTERAVSYRAARAIDPRTVRLAAVVQRMVEAQVAGVLFTANPLTGKRDQAVLDANPGLGEAVVAGLTDPDHFVVDTPTSAIVERRLGGKQIVIRPLANGGTEQVAREASPDGACLTDDQVRMLAALGARVAAQTGVPQDIEWAIDPANQIWLLQTRPITTLFPLPADVPPAGEALRVYLSFNVQQGTYRPFTPLGISTVRVLAGALAALCGFPPPDPLAGPGFVTEAAGRIYLDVTAALQNPLGRRLLGQSMADAEVQAAAIFDRLSADPRIADRPTSPGPLVRGLGRLLVRTRLPLSLVRVLVAPRSSQARLRRLIRRLRAAGRLSPTAAPGERLTAAERLLRQEVLRVMVNASPAMVGGMLSLTLARKLLGALATEDELQILLRGLPGDLTAEMTLALAALAAQVGSVPAIRQLVEKTPPAHLAEDYRRDRLPALLQRGLAAFLARYGHRSVSELDLGMPRWAEDPAYVLGMLAGFLALRDSDQAPAAQHRRAAQEAAAMVRTLTARARRRSRLRGRLVGFCLSRARALGGQREAPRFCLALLLARVRVLLQPVGQELVRAGRLAQAGDVFFLTFPEVHIALAGTDMQATVRGRRAAFDRELSRRHVPLVLLSDGTEPAAAQESTAGEPDMLRGTPASPGVVTALARVIHDPHDAHLARGEILIAPATDPGWTPLFLIAGGLVVETGGAMSHGAIVAREYGLPAVVGVPQATRRIATGSRITVDGTTGLISLQSADDGGEGVASRPGAGAGVE
jgi:pyruvate,water dikinase